MKKIKQIVRLVGVLTLVTGMVLQLIPSGMASAAQITTRSLTLQPGGTDGGSKAGGVVNHFFTFTVPTTASIGSIQFLYCTLAAGTCTTPTGLVTTSATYGVESGATGFSLVNATNGAPYITRAAASITAATVVSYHLNTITNPTTANQTFYVRLTTFTSTTATTGATDAGVVAASTANQITLTGTVQVVRYLLLPEYQTVQQPPADRYYSTSYSPLPTLLQQLLRLPPQLTPTVVIILLLQVRR
jgi:hypothetical protein